MLRIDSPYGRLYEISNGLLLPSTTKVLKATEKRGFSKTVWSKKLTTKGLSDYESQIYAEHWIAQGWQPALAHKHTEQFILTPMEKVQAAHYMNWKSEHSASRGNRLHSYLETCYQSTKSFNGLAAQKAMTMQCKNCCSHCGKVKSSKISKKSMP